MDQPAQIIKEPSPAPVVTNVPPSISPKKTSKITLILLVVLVVGIIVVQLFFG